MLRTSLVAALVSFATPALADRLEIEAGSYTLKVGQLALLPSAGVADVQLKGQNLDRLWSPSGEPYLRFRALRPGRTRLEVRKASGAVYRYDFVVVDRGMVASTR